ncbi:MAG: AAA family ATPase [Desulfobacterales bacterium]
MENDAVIISNPFKLSNSRTADLIEKGGFGAVAARAGVGKTAMLVQLALNKMLMGENVMHISLNEPVTKVSLWYKEIFTHLADQNSVSDAGRLWESILPHRFIMTFRVEGFSAPKLEERMTDLSEQHIFLPDMIIIDGLPFTETVREPLVELKRLAERYGTVVWFTVTTHRHEEAADEVIPPQLKPVKDMFRRIIKLKPEGRMIHVYALISPDSGFNQTPLVFDPFSMTVREQSGA